jgi:hypothetical protein
MGNTPMETESMAVVSYLRFPLALALVLGGALGRQQSFWSVAARRTSWNQFWNL